MHQGYLYLIHSLLRRKLHPDDTHFSLISKEQETTCCSVGSFSRIECECQIL